MRAPWTVGSVGLPEALEGAAAALVEVPEGQQFAARRVVSHLWATAAVHVLPAGRRLILGRDPASDVRISDPTLWRPHGAAASWSWPALPPRCEGSSPRSA